MNRREYCKAYPISSYKDEAALYEQPIIINRNNDCVYFKESRWERLKKWFKGLLKYHPHGLGGGRP
jgi:hypothetical protein